MLTQVFKMEEKANFCRSPEMTPASSEIVLAVELWFTDIVCIFETNPVLSCVKLLLNNFGSIGTSEVTTTGSKDTALFPFPDESP